MSNATQPQYREVSRKANEGERIKIVAAACTGGLYNNGDELVVDSVESTGVYAKHTNGRGAGIWHREYVVLEPIANLPDLFSQFIRDNADAVRSYLAEIDPVDSAEPSIEENVSEPPLTRAKVIKMARERVAELERIGSNANVELPQGPFKTKFYNVEFHVNRNKRTVTALVRKGRGRGGKPDAVGIAKCAPDDVFNADIGKAIAAERALGLTLTPEFVNAPKPEKASAGMRVVSAGKTYSLIDPPCMPKSGEAHVGSFVGKSGTIVDDTDAVYEEEREAA